MRMIARLLPSLVLPPWLAAAGLLWSPTSIAQSLPQGDYVGQLGPLTIVVHFTPAADGGTTCTLDSPNQGARGIVCNALGMEGESFTFRVPAVNGSWQGTVSDDGATLTGNWSQGTPMPLVLKRQTGPVEVAPLPAVTFDAAIAPVEAGNLEAVLRDDLMQSLAGGVLAPGSGVGVTVGVITRSGRSVFALGAAQPDTLFEIGSITKTFTGLVLAQLVEQGTVTAGTPVRELLPAGTVAKPEGAEITLLDLAKQHSGMPRMPDNFAPRDPANPYVDYDAARLHAFVAKHGVARPADAVFEYSNVGLGLLGHALARAAGQSYEQLVTTQVLQPLGMSDTAIVLPPALQARFIVGHVAAGVRTHSWELDALAGAGALRSTAADMLRYLEAQLDPAGIAGDAGPARTLPAALRRAQQPEGDALPNMRVGYAWLQETATGTYWHNGGTGGFTSFAFFNAEAGHAVVVLANLGIQAQGSFADQLAQHIGQRLMGRPAISLAAW